MEKQKLEEILKNLIFIDVETPNCRNSSVCQIAIISNEFELNEIVNPCVEFDSFNKTFHGIDEIKVFGKSNFKKAFLEKINLLDSKYIFVGHNISFDAHVIVKDALRYGVEIKKLNTICTKKLYEKFFPDCGPYDLKSLCSYFGIELLKHHDAYSDAIACKELFESAIKSNNIEGDINSHIKQMNFNTSLNKIKYDSYPQILNLRKALFIQVYSDLKNNKFMLINWEFPKQWITDQFNNYIKWDCKYSNVNSYVDFIKITQYNLQTINTIYLQIMLIYFSFDNTIDLKKTEYILKWLNSLDDNLKKNFPFDYLLCKLENSSKRKIITNEEAHEIIFSVDRNILWWSENLIYDDEIYNNETIKDINGFDFSKNKDEGYIFQKINSNEDLFNKKFYLIGQFKKFKSCQHLSSLLEKKFKMTENKRLTQYTHFLIVGSLGNSGWIYGNNHESIEKAILLRNGQSIIKIKIISEEELSKFI